MYIFEEIAKELGIERYASESDDQFSFRVFYSSAGEWIRTVSQLERNSSKMLSKSSLRSVIKELYTVLTFLNENLQNMCSSNDDDNLNDIRDTLFKSGDLIEYGFQSAICSCVDHFANYSGNFLLHIGKIGHDEADILSGLSYIRNNNSDDNSISVFDVFNIPKIGYMNIYKKYTDKLKQNSAFSLDELEFLNIKSKKVISASWENTPSYNSDNIALARVKMVFGKYQYKIIKHCDDAYLSYDFDDYEQDPDIRETQRFLYAIKKEQGSPATVLYENNGYYSRWTYWSRLPSPEDFLLRYIGWPLDGLKNQRNIFLIRSELDDLVNSLNENLGIERINGDEKI